VFSEYEGKPLNIDEVIADARCDAMQRLEAMETPGQVVMSAAAGG
jgi:hypothetical protein